MTPEELEFSQKHPEYTERHVKAFIADWKHGQAVKNGAKRAAEQGMTTQSLPLNGAAFCRDAVEQ